MQGIWARKSIAALEAEAEEPEVQALTTHNGVPLKRTLSALNLAALGVGAIIGAGIFVLTGHAAAANAGPAITLSFVLGAIACVFAGLCYAEMSSTVPIAGSAYTYAYATLGELIAWIIGWDLILEYMLGAATVAIGWSGYVVSFFKDFGVVVPQALAAAPFAYDPATDAWHATGAILNIPAMIVVVAITAVLVVGVRESARANAVIVAIKLVIILVFIAVAAPFVSTAHWVTAANPSGNFIPPNTGPGQFGVSGVLRRAVCEHGALGDRGDPGGQFHSAEYRPRPVRVQRCLARRCGGFLRLYRVRRRFDRRAGSQEPAARHADRHSRLACPVHGALRCGRYRAHRHRALRQAQRTR